ncbi:MAG: class I SAM-dependent methyltransferase [Myxococcota bacterium]|jgi:23S rRNA (cytosine1962-C5)-methyltransferase|nr:class I SAM-dependent methyltransferase [Myxococcota bacterium]
MTAPAHNENQDYALLASGDGRKLERFGRFILDRPAPQAIWEKSPGPWDQASATFQRGEGGSGQWTTIRGLDQDDGWPVLFHTMRLELRLTGFGNVGLFPEHAAHFAWMKRRLLRRDKPRVLNLFGYTGAASIVCALAGAEVVHVDAAKTVNAWASLNAKACEVPRSSLRLLEDDALKLLRREARRDSKYDGILLDPPTFGRGPKGEVWKIEKDFAPLCAALLPVLSEQPAFVLSTSHSPGVSGSVLETLLAPLRGEVESGEMLLTGSGPPLPSGFYARWIPGP